MSLYLLVLVTTPTFSIGCFHASPP
jgi:hypothetical protein